ncbi:MAG TPA: hypothetical protein VHC73_11190 [Vitreimonas sp.]|nr:hypothetical protein [Vitreimonas sp.]
MTQVTLRADCARCAALCCVALAFDRSELFAFDKAAGEPCPHLCGGQCAIHAVREARGFSGCAAYDCLGAGQYVVQNLFGGAAWQDEPALLQPMLRAFAVVRRAHELLALLETATRLPLSGAERRRLKTLQRELHAAAAAARTKAWDERLARETHGFLRSLVRHVRQLAVRQELSG